MNQVAVGTVFTTDTTLVSDEIFMVIIQTSGRPSRRFASNRCGGTYAVTVVPGTVRSLFGRRSSPPTIRVQAPDNAQSPLATGCLTLRDSANNTLLHLTEDVEYAKALLEIGVPIDAKNEDGYTPLMAACERLDTKMVKMLLERGADAHTACTEGPLLHRALTVLDCNGETDITLIRLLLEHGADINQKNPDGGGTALHLAVDAGNLEHVAFLLERGADPTIPDDQGTLPVDFVENLELCKLLLNARPAEPAKIHFKKDTLVSFESGAPTTLFAGSSLTVASGAKITIG